MTVTPAPPTDVPSLLAAYLQSVEAVRSLAAGLTDEQLALPSPCPGWNVFDQVAHVESVDAMFLGEPVPELDVSGRGHVRSPLGEIMERLVESRRGRPVAELIAGSAVHLERRQEQWSGLGEQDQIPGPFGPGPAPLVISLRAFDVWCHEQDIRESVGRPGGLDTPSAANAIARVYAALPRVVGSAGLPVGSSVVVVVEGPVSATGGYRVVEVEGRTRGVEASVPPRSADAQLTLGTWEAGRLAAGRTPVGAPYAWAATGDADLAQAVVANFAITP